MVHPKDTTVGMVYLNADGEARLLEAAQRGGGVVRLNRTALEQLMVSTVALLAEIDDALTLPPIIQDIERRAN